MRPADAVGARQRSGAGRGAADRVHHPDQRRRRILHRRAPGIQAARFRLQDDDPSDRSSDHRRQLFDHHHARLYRGGARSRRGHGRHLLLLPGVGLHRRRRLVRQCAQAHAAGHQRRRRRQYAGRPRIGAAVAAGTAGRQRAWAGAAAARIDAMGAQQPASAGARQHRQSAVQPQYRQQPAVLARRRQHHDRALLSDAHAVRAPRDHRFHHRLVVRLFVHSRDVSVRQCRRDHRFRRIPRHRDAGAHARGEIPASRPDPGRAAGQELERMDHRRSSQERQPLVVLSRRRAAARDQSQRRGSGRLHRRRCEKSQPQAAAVSAAIPIGTAPWRRFTRSAAASSTTRNGFTRSACRRRRTS